MVLIDLVHFREIKAKALENIYEYQKISKHHLKINSLSRKLIKYHNVYLSLNKFYKTSFNKLQKRFHSKFRTASIIYELFYN